MHDVFISHSSKDKGVADAVCARLEQAGIRCWIAPRDIVPGVNWDETIVDAIRASQVMVLVFSMHSNESTQIANELQCAVSSGVNILPLRIADVRPSKALAYHLGRTHWLDAITPPLERHLKRIVSNTTALLGRKPPIPSPVKPAVARSAWLTWGAPVGTLAMLFLLGVLAMRGTTPNGKNANGELTLARQLRQEGHFIEAVQLLDGALATARADERPKLRVERAWSNLLRSEYADVIQDCTEVIESAPNTIDADLVLAWPLRGWARFYEAMDTAGFIEDCQTAVARIPQSALPLAARSLAFTERQDFPSAIADAEKAIQLAPNSAWGQMALAHAYVTQGLVEKAEVAANAGVTLDPHNPYAAFARAEVQYLKGAFGASVIDASRGLEKAPKYLGLRSIRCLAYLSQGDFKSARADAEACEQYGHDSPLSVVIRVGFHNAMGEIETSLELAEQAVQSHPDSWMAFYVRALSHVQSARVNGVLAESALEDANKAVELSNNHAMAYIVRGLVYLAKQDPNRAIQDFKTVDQRGIRLPDNLLFWAQSLAASGDPVAAQAKFDEAAKSFPNNPDVFTFRCYYLTGVEEYEAALQDAERCVQLAPSAANSWLLRASCHGYLDHWEQARTDADQCLQLSKELPLAYFWRGRAAFELGDHADAIVDFDSSIEMTEDTSWDHYYRGWCYYHLGNFVAAFEDLDMAIHLGNDASDVHYGRAEARFRSQPSPTSVNLAMEDVAASVARNPNDASLYVLSAEMNVHIKEWQSVIDDASIAIQKSEAMADDVRNALQARAFFFRGVALQARGDDEAAKKDLEAARLLDDTLVGELSAALVP